MKQVSRRRRTVWGGVALALVAAAALLVPAVPAGAAIFNFTLCAREGTVTMPDSVVVTIWGYAPGPCADGAPAQIPGPVLTLPATNTLRITLQVDAGMPEGVGLTVPTLAGRPDLTTVAPGGSRVYTWTNVRTGTHMYQSAVNSPVQIPLGLYGAVIVTPASLPSTYVADATEVLVLSELDVDLNDHPSGDPNEFNFNDFAPEYFLINGEAFPDTDPLVVGPTCAGPTVCKLLVRYLNAGSSTHSMGALGLNQLVVASSSRALAFPRRSAFELLVPGQTLDVRFDILRSVGDRSYPLYNRNGRLMNALAFAGGGGMMTSIDVTFGPVPIGPTLYTSTRTTPSPIPGFPTSGAAAARDEDILYFNGSTWSLFFDGSAAGLPATSDVDALRVLGPTDVQVSLDAPATVPGLGTVDDSDIIGWNGSTWSMVLDGSTKGLTTDNEDIDAFDVLSNGHFIVSLSVSGSVTGVTTVADEDLIELVSTAGSGTWAVYFDGSDVGLTNDIDAVQLESASEMLVSTEANVTLAPTGAVNDEDAVRFTFTTSGASTTGTWAASLYFDGSTQFTAETDIDGLGL